MVIILISPELVLSAPLQNMSDLLAILGSTKELTWLLSPSWLAEA